jgi:hypothetical protein
MKNTSQEYDNVIAICRYLSIKWLITEVRGEYCDCLINRSNPHKSAKNTRQENSIREQDRKQVNSSVLSIIR